MRDRPRLVAQQAVKTPFHEALLPAPDAGLGLAGLAHDRVGAHAIGRKHDNLGAPNVLLGRVAVRNQDPKTTADCGRDGEGDSIAHAPDSHAPASRGIPIGIQMSDFTH